LEQFRKPAIYVSPVPNPGSYADPWGKVEGLTFVFPGSNSPKTTTRERGYALLASGERKKEAEETPEPSRKQKKSKHSKSSAEQQQDSAAIATPELSDSQGNVSRENSKLKSLFHRKKKNS
jgi:hypothetical protein